MRLARLSTGIAIGFLGSLIPLASTAQTSCGNFWVNPETGQEECLDGVLSSPSPPSEPDDSPTPEPEPEQAAEDSAQPSESTESTEADTLPESDAVPASDAAPLPEPPSVPGEAAPAPTGNEK
jgi:hypothetical protein